jgi:hypothetical protein
VSQLVAHSVPHFVAADALKADSFAFVIRCEAGTSGTERRQRMSPPSHPESGETAFPKDGARLGLPT